MPSIAFASLSASHLSYVTKWILQENLLWRDHLLVYEYFHDETGKGLGASHQTSWTALVTKLIQECFDVHPRE